MIQQAVNKRLHAARPGPRAGFGGAAFTLIELLVVVAVVALLAGMLLPALSSAQARSQAAACMNNHRQLALALQVYTDDHSGKLPYNWGAAGIRRSVSLQSYLNWANNVMSWELDPGNTNRYQLVAGGLGPYLNGAAGPFKCPTDRVLSRIQREAGWTARLRSVSLNAMMGYAGRFLSGNVNTNNPAHTQFFRLDDVREPSRIFTFIDEHPDSINDGYFLNRIDRFEWVDLPGSYHHNGATITFADGHVERQRWIDGITKPPAQPDVAVLPVSLPAGQRADFEWLADRTSMRRVGDQ